MTYGELIQMYFERSNALQWYWTIYVLVIGGLLAFSSFRKQRDVITTALVTVLFCFFAYKNLDAIRDVTLQRYAILDLIKQSSMEHATPESTRASVLIEPTLRPPAFKGVRNFHAVSDLLTIATLWAMELRRKRAAQGDEHSR